jgi:N-acetylmuramoyl-L-alanine amidase
MSEPRGGRLPRAIAPIALVIASILPGFASAARATAGAGAPSLKPPIRARPIPFGHRRLRETARYSRRHYGQHSWRLRHPNVIVEHYTDGPSFRSAYRTFASDAPHMGERPGVCAHFVIDSDGAIYQLVDLDKRCRHTIGLNWTAVGIEHVATSDRQVLHSRRMMRASLRLTVWLMVRYGISIGNVIGHAESLRSRYHRERYRTWRCLTHSDWLHRDMKVYRRRLRRVAVRQGVPVGPGPDWVRSRC